MKDWTKVQAFCWRRWTEAEKEASRAPSRSIKRRRAEARCDFWRQMHAKAEDNSITQNHPKILEFLATERKEDQHVTYDRPRGRHLPEQEPDLEFVYLGVPNPYERPHS